MIITIYSFITFYFYYIFRGDVVTMECVEKIIKKDWIHPLTNEKLTEKDIIPMQRVCINIKYLFQSAIY